MFEHLDLVPSEGLAVRTELIEKVLRFEGIECRIIDHNDDDWFRAADLARMLGYKDSNGINRVFSRHKGDFRDEETQLVLLDTEGNVEKTSTLDSLSKEADENGAFYGGTLDNLSKVAQKRIHRIYSMQGAQMIALLAGRDRSLPVRRALIDFAKIVMKNGYRKQIMRPRYKELWLHEPTKRAEVQHFIDDDARADYVADLFDNMQKTCRKLEEQGIGQDDIGSHMEDYLF